MKSAYSVRVRVEIAPVEEGRAGTHGGAADLAGVEEEAVRVVSAGTAKSIDDMEEVLLEDTFAVLRQALGKHFEEVSKRGLLSGSSPGS